jgi:hypothetical protein
MSPCAAAGWSKALNSFTFEVDRGGPSSGIVDALVGVATMLRLPSWLFSCALMLSAAGAVAACVLNPQPLPPDTADSGPGASTVNPGAEAGGGGGADGGGAEDVSLNQGDGDVGSPPDGAADGESDAGDAAYDGSADADGSSDGGSGDGADTDAPDTKGD